MTRIPTDTRDKLIEAARDLFHLQGYAQTSVSQILKRAEVNAGSLYYYFPTKEDLLTAVLEWYRDHIEDDLIQLHTAHIQDPLEKIFGLLDGYRQMLLCTEFELGCPIGALALELSNTHPAARSLLLVNFEQWVDCVEKWLIEASDRLPTDTDLRTLALMILSTMEGGMMLAKTYRSTANFDRSVASLRSYIEMLVAQAANWNSPRPTPPLESAL